MASVGLVLAAGGVFTAYSTSLYAAATSVAIVTILSMKVDIAAVPCALYACIAPVAVYHIWGGNSNWQPGMTLDVSSHHAAASLENGSECWSSGTYGFCCKLLQHAQTLHVLQCQCDNHITGMWNFAVHSSALKLCNHCVLLCLSQKATNLQNAQCLFDSLLAMSR